MVLRQMTSRNAENIVLQKTLTTSYCLKTHDLEVDKTSYSRNYNEAKTYHILKHMKAT